MYVIYFRRVDVVQIIFLKSTSSVRKSDSQGTRPPHRLYCLILIKYLNITFLPNSKEINASNCLLKNSSLIRLCSDLSRSALRND